MRPFLLPGAVAIGLVLIGSMIGASGLLEPRGPEDVARERVELARRIYGHVEEQLKTPAAIGAEAINAPRVFEELALWSRRWMESEHDLDGARAARATALEAHVKRLKAWEELGRQMLDGDGFGMTQLALDKLIYDRLEAEFRLAKLNAAD